MNQNLVVVFDYLKFWMIDEQTRAFALDATEHNQPLPGRNHLLDVMQIKPAAGERLAERVRATFLQQRFKDFAPAETHQSRLCDLAAQPNRDDGFFTRGPSRLHRARDKAWLRIYVTEGFQHFVPMQQIEVDRRQRDFSVEVQARTKPFVR